MKFRIWAILWVFALLASALATFEFVTAVPLSFVIVFSWFVMLQWFARPGFTLVELITVLAVWAVLYALLFPTINPSFEAERVADCHAKLTNAAQAVLNYCEQHNRLPIDGIFTHSDGVTHSWRVIVGSQLGKNNKLQEYDLSKPWNDHFNLTVSGKESPGLCCRNDSGYAKDGKTIGTSYFAVTGLQTAWTALSSPNGKFTDDPSRTILLIENLERGVGWNKPKDLTFQEALSLLTIDPSTRPRQASFHWAVRNGFFAKRPPIQGAKGIHAAFADGSVRFVGLPLSKELAIALLTANGGETISDADFDKLWKAEIDYARIYSLSVFMLLSLAPTINLCNQNATTVRAHD